MHGWNEQQFWIQQVYAKHLDSDTFFFEQLQQNLPPVFTRQTASLMVGGLLSAKTLSNLDALGQGPPKVRLGNKVGYERSSFIAWLQKRLK